MPQTKLVVDEVELDLGRYELRRTGRRVKLEKKPMELLILLVSRREQLVGRDEIVRQLWRSHLFVDTERSINNIVRKVRAALHDDADSPRFLETVVGKGYRFIGPVRVIAPQYPRPEAPPRGGSLEPKAGAGRRENPSVAVLPLLWLGKESDDQAICFGFADSMVARLGNLQGLDVLPVATVLNVQADARPAEIAERLGVRFVVHGAIQVSKRQQLSVEMYDAFARRACFSRKCDLELQRLPAIESDIARQIAGVLNRPMTGAPAEKRPRHSRDPLAYAEFIRGYRLTVAGDSAVMDKSAQYLIHAVTRDPGFALAHATLSFACATRHFEFDPANSWLEKAEFHCRRSLELAPDLAEGYLARAFLQWGPSKNFQHLEAIADLKRAIGLQNNLPHAYNRLGTILAHIGLLDHAREVYQRGAQLNPTKVVSPSIVQVYVWNQEYELAKEQTEAWRAESPHNKYPLYIAPQVPMMIGDWEEASRLSAEAVSTLPDEPMITSLQGVVHALMGRTEAALECATRACSSPKTFGHAHHTYYHLACIHAVIQRPETAFEWLDRSVGSGFACWPFFLKDHCLENLRGRPEFELLISTLQAKYPYHLGLL
jgi:DNA-binding winged helix-turn-helix (wHTH) protein/tetratricopeptide (TPR) repeat protein